MFATAFTNVSDERTKSDIHEVSYGLAELLRLNPIEWIPLRAKDAPQELPGITPEEHRPDLRVDYLPKTKKLGFSAQNVRDVLPEASALLEPEVEDSLLAIDLAGILAVVVNSIKELNARIGG
jgi:hypothetical protein